MRETQMFEEIWKEFQREISEEQAFSLSLLMAFSWHYGEWQDDFGLDIGSGAMVSQGSLIESIKGIQGYDVREAFSRLSERINWQVVEQEAVQRLLKKMIDCFVWYGKKGEDPREVFALILDLMGRDGKCVLTPPGVRRVIVELLGPRKAKHLASSCCGGAGLGLELWDYLRLRNPEISFCGEEQSRELCDVANLYSYAYGVSAGEIVERDVLTIPEERERQRYDMIVMDVPRGRNVTELCQSTDPRLYGFTKRNIYADWIFIQDALYRLSEHGSAAVIVTPGSLIRRNEVSLREQIVVNDWLEAVITFPNNLYPKDHTGRELLIFNKAKKRKGKIIFLDISGYCQRTGRNVHSLTEEGIKLAKKVFDSAEQIPGVSAVCGREEIGENAFSLKPLQYIRRTGEKEIQSGITLEEIAQIVRGSQLLKKSDIKESGAAFFINIKDIQNARLEFGQADRIQRTSSVCKAKFRISKDDILLTSKGAVLKAAIVEANPPEAYISGNITMIRVDQRKYDPYVLFEFLISEQGQIALERIQSGTTIRIISNASLQTLKVPNYDLARMKQIGGQLRRNQERYYREITEATTRFQKERGRLLDELEELT